MSKSTMNQYTLQSYFKSLCKSFDIAYTQVKRLEKIEGETDYSEEAFEFWGNLLWEKNEEIAKVIVTIMENDFSIIITSEEEQIALMAFYYEYPVEKYRIINVDEKYLPLFPKGEIGEKFLKAYVSKDEEAMQKLYEKYF